MSSTDNIHADFPWKPYIAKHKLVDNPLFELKNIIELSRRLPLKQVEYNTGDLSVGHDPQQTPVSKLSVQDTLESIEKNNSWMVLKNIQDDPEYKKLLHETLDEILANCNCSELGQCGRYRAFLFVSSPNSVTPFHADPEHNFLLQINGKKTMYQWMAGDQEVVAHQDMEKTYFGDYSHRNLPFNESLMKKAMQFDLQAGDTLHVPLNAPHWVKNGEEVSISFSITFQSDYSERRHKLYTLNAMLRQSGLTEKSIDENKLRDRLLLFIGFKGVNILKALFS